MKRIRETLVIVMKTITEAGEPLMQTEIEERAPKLRGVASILRLCVQDKYLKSGYIEGKKRIAYNLTAAGQKVLDNLDSYEISPYRPNPNATQPKRGNKKQAATTEPQIQPVPTFNLSGSAEQLMDQISSVVQENAAYREAMEKTCNQLARFLGMKLVPINQESNESESD